MRATRSADAVRDRRIERFEALISPQELLEELPLGAQRTETVVQGRTQTHAIIDGQDDRLLVVVGPCSIHDAKATLDTLRTLAVEGGRPGVLEA